MALLLLTLSACTAVSIKDSEWCGSLASKGAACFHTLTTDSRRLSLEQFAVYWNDLSEPKVCTTASVLADFKADIEKLCSDHQGACSYEVEKAVSEASQRLGKVVEQAKRAK